jgi:hypothetical protein
VAERDMLVHLIDIQTHARQTLSYLRCVLQCLALSSGIFDVLRNSFVCWLAESPPQSSCRKTL